MGNWKRQEIKLKEPTRLTMSIVMIQLCSALGKISCISFCNVHNMVGHNKALPREPGRSAGLGRTCDHPTLNPSHRSRASCSPAARARAKCRGNHPTGTPLHLTQLPPPCIPAARARAKCRGTVPLGLPCTWPSSHSKLPAGRARA